MKPKIEKLIVILISTIIILQISKPLLSAFFSPKGTNLIKEENYSENSGTFESLRKMALEFSGWSEKDHIHLSLEPNSKGHAVYRFEKPQEARLVFLESYFVNPDSGSNELKISTDLKNWQTIYKNHSVDQEGTEITSFLQNTKTFYITFEAENKDAQNSPPLEILTDLRILYYKEPINIPYLPFIITILTIPTLFIIAFPKTKWTLTPFAIALIPIPFILLLFFVSSYPGNPLLYPSSLGFKYSMLMLLLSIFLILPFKKIRSRLLTPLLLLFVINIGLNQSLQNLYSLSYHSLDPDTVCIAEKAIPSFNIFSLKSGSFSTFCYNKESVTPIIYLLFYKFFGFGSEIGIRFSTVIFHLLTLILVFIYGKRIGNQTTGFLASLYLAAHPYLSQLSVRGLRDVYFTFGITAFVFLLFESKLSLLRNKILIIISMIFLIYNRANSINQILVILFFYSLLKIRLRHFAKAIPTIVFLTVSLSLIFLPGIIASLKTYHVWNYSDQSSMKWFRNTEFKGQPNFPSAEEVTRSPFTEGKSITTLEYFFELHKADDLMFSTIKGVFEAFNNIYLLGNILFFFIFLLGSKIMLNKTNLAYIPILIFILEIPHFFLLQKGLLEYRNLTQSLPFVALTLGYSINYLLSKVRSLKTLPEHHLSN